MLVLLGGTSRAGRYNHITLGTSACSGHMEGDLLVLHALITKCIPVVQVSYVIITSTNKENIIAFVCSVLWAYHKEESGITHFTLPIRPIIFDVLQVLVSYLSR